MPREPANPPGSDSRGRNGNAYVTYFDSGYLPRAEVMLASLRSVGDMGPLVAVCFDDGALAAMRGRADQGVIAVPLAALEAAYPALGSVREERSPAEYFFTCTPWAVLYAASLLPEARWITYLDADLAFFSSPGGIYDELEGPGDGRPATAGIIAHDYLPSRRGLERFGRYNVGWVSFANDDRGHALLTWWGEQCLRWCGDEPGENGFADQGYLDRFSDVDPDVRVIRLPGAHLGPWNVGSHEITAKPTDTGDGLLGPGLLVDGSPLVSYHVHGLRRFGTRYAAMHLAFGTRGGGLIGQRVYAPYVRALARAEAAHPGPSKRGARRGRGWRGAMARARRQAYYALAVVRGETWRAPDPGSDR